MTLEEILKQVQVQLEISADEIDWDDDETKARVTLANSAILTWATTKGTLWQELLKTFETDEIEQGEENELALPKDYRAVVESYLANGQDFKITDARTALKSGYAMAFVEGNGRTGRKIKFSGEIKDGDNRIGQTIKLLYLAHPTLLKNPIDKPEMSDPSFIVDYICAAVATDDDQSKYTVFSTNYAQKLEDMIVLNNELNLTEDNGLEVNIGE